MTLVIFLILCFTITAFSSTKLPEESTIKNLLFFDSFSAASPTFFRTKQGSISYNGVNGDAGRDPEYLLINFNPANVTTILKDISQACDPVMYTFSKLHYHEQTSSLVYYCANNNTLLILDETTFKTKITIPVDLNITFEETRISDDGDSIAIVCINQLYNYTHPPSHLIIINLATKTVTTNVIFDKHLNSSQILVGFASCGLRKYVVTSTLGVYVLMNISEIVILGNTYELVPLANVNYQTDYMLSFLYVPELYCIGNLVITNSNSQLIFFDIKNQTPTSIDGLQFRSFSFNHAFPELPIIGRGQTNNVLYANVRDENRNNVVIRYTINGSSITSDLIANGSFAQISRGTNLQRGDLVFVLPQSLTNLFQVVDVESLKTIYLMSNSYDRLMSTDSTYAVLNFQTLYVFNLTNDAIIQDFSVVFPSDLSAVPLYYHDLANGIFYALNQTDFNSRTCDLISIDLKTTELQIVDSFNDRNICTGRITQVGLPEKPEAVIKNSDSSSFFILSNTYGFLNFQLPQEFLLSFILADFSNLSIKLVGNRQKVFGGWSLANFEFNNETQQFTMTSASKLPNMNLIDGKTFYTLQENTIYATTGPFLAVINTTSSSVNTYSSLFNHILPSLTQNGNSMIVSDDPLKPSSGNSPYLLISGSEEPLPGVTKNTFGAQATGSSTYYLVDGYGSGVRLVTFHKNNKIFEPLYY